MLEKYKSFFAEDGITSTSASHLCNLAREHVALAQIDLANINFVEKSVNLLNSPYNPTITNYSIGNIEDIRKNIDQIAKSNAFIAYMREAINAKSHAYNEIEQLKVSEYAEMKGIKMPEQPVTGEKKTFNDFFGELSIKEKNRFYAIEAKAAVIGKAIHPDGPVHCARQQMFNAINTPAKVEGDKVYYYKVTVNKENVEKIYFDLQKQHRALEAELNAIKNSIELKVREYNAKVDSEYSKAWSEYTTSVKEFHNIFTDWKNAELKKVIRLKIAIPEALQETYEFLNSL